MGDKKLSDEAKKARAEYMKEYRRTREGKEAQARANKRYWEKKARELQEQREA